MQAKRTHATPDVLRGWSDLVQLSFVDVLPQVAPWTCRQVAFHGGTSLNLSWNSPRFSEDLDFLLEHSQASAVEGIMEKALVKMRALLVRSHPGLFLELKNKSKEASNLAHFQIVVSSDQYLEKAMVKVEFWKVDRSYLESYGTTFVTPVRRGDIVTRASVPISAATLDAAFADKLTAFATRPHLKWRDLFDLWWLNQQSPQNLEQAAGRFLHHVSAYNTIGGLPPADALRSFLARQTAEQVMSKADPDLKKWLPPMLWQQLHPSGVRQIVDFTYKTLGEVATCLDRQATKPLCATKTQAP